MSDTSTNKPRIETGRQMLIAGLRSHYTAQTMNEIPAQWQRFASYLGKIPGQVSGTAYGLCLNSSGANGIDYVSGVEVSGASGLPPEFSAVNVPAQTYAVFLHHGHVSTLSETIDAIWKKWLPDSGHQVKRTAGGTPDFFERYAESFDPQTGIGSVEVWIPVGRER